MNWLRSLAIAFSTYSRIPVPQVTWSPKNAALSMAFLPGIGVITGLLLYAWRQLALFWDLQPLLFAAVATVIPLAVSGGIHLDGLCDTADALSSHQSRERKLEILKDAHIGAFGVMVCLLYLLLWAGCLAQLQHEQSFVSCCFIFVLSRSVSGLAVQYIPNARGKGMLQTFTDCNNRKIVMFILVVWFLGSISVLCWQNLWLCVWMLFAVLLSFVWFYRMIKREFGGLTGDLIGCYLQICELSMAFAVIVGGKMWNFI